MKNKVIEYLFTQRRFELKFGQGRLLFFNVVFRMRVRSKPEFAEG